MHGVTTTTTAYSSVEMRRQLFLATRQEHDAVFPHNVRRSFGFRKTKPCIAGAALSTWVERTWMHRDWHAARLPSHSVLESTLNRPSFLEDS